MNKRDYYKVLGVERAASAQDLKRAYRTLAKRYHPDLNPGDLVAESEFKAVAEAYQVLQDAQRRTAYDRFGHEGLDPRHCAGAGFEKVEDIFDQFNDLFGDVFGFGEQQRKQKEEEARRAVERGEDITHELELSFEEAVHGTRKIFKIMRETCCETCLGSGAKPGTRVLTCDSCEGRGEISSKQGFFAVTSDCKACQGKGIILPHPCGDCDGAGRFQEEHQLSIQIPAGVDDGSRLRARGEGEAGRNGGPRGDVIVQLSVEPSEIYERDNLNLHYRATLSFIQAACGCTLHVPILRGKSLSIQIEPGAQFGDIHNIEGEGVPHVNGRRTGNMLVHLMLTTPRDLSASELSLMQQLAALRDLSDEVSPEDFSAHSLEHEEPLSGISSASEI